VAYLTVRGESAPSAEALRTHLRAVLPEYMVPSAFVIVESLPLTANGKLNRRALPAPGLQAYAGREYEAPRGEVEQVLAGIWQELLGLPRVGRNDNFFELGGHSLLAPQVLSRVETAFQMRLTLRDFFAAPTVAGLAAQIDLVLLREIEALSDEEVEMLEASVGGGAG